MTDPAVVGAPVGDAPDAAIAIVGVACRLPGGITTLDELWLALAAKRDLVGEVTPDRFDTSRFFDANRHRPGKSYAFAAGLLDDIAGFDAEFFGMSPAEASRIDPQQRLLLELAVEAVDDSGIDPGSLAGSDTCVYVGVCDQSYLTLQSEDPRSINAYTQSGGAPGNTANRLSHWLDIRGPSVAMDTACSSSLVALHHACDLLRSGVSEIGLVGGVSILLNPYFFVGFAKASMLSPSGRCRTFSAAADGYVRAEGGAVIVLKRLAEARADGDRVHGVILASGTNSDGRTVGLSHPSCDAQEALLRDVYDRARVEPDDLAYLEAHGTGTVVGDPVECEAIGRALGSRRSPGRSLPIGSIKSNVGHLEAASGLAGVLKGLLVLRHGVIPASLHALPLNPSIDFAGWQLEPVTDTRPLPGPSEVTVVGINSFGMGGANAHVILARPAPEPNGPPPDTRPAPRQLPILVSAHSPPALVEVAHRLAETLAGVAADDFYDLCYTACRRRGHHAYRAVVLAEDVRAATRQFEDLSQGLASGAGVTGVTPVPAGGRRLVFVFSGNGSQWAGMGADLLEAEPTFRVAVEEVDRLLVPRLGWSVLDELRAPPEESRLDRTDVAQPALFALQVGLVALLREHGIAPDAVVGHSVGEVAAAHAAGALDLASAALVVAERSRAQSRTAHQGSMAAVGLSADEAAKAIAPYAERLELAAVNSDQDVTVSGERAALEALGEDLRPQDVFFRMLDIDYPFHSRAMDPLEAPLLTGLSAVTCSEARLPMASTATGHLLGRHDRLDGRYWWRNVREPVLFGPAVRALANEGYGLFLEVGPHPILGRYLKRVTAHEAPPAAVLATLSKECDGPDSLRRSVAMLMAVGAEIDWDVYFPHAGRVTALPTYPWQRERHWNGSPQAWGRMGGDGAILDHPLLGGRLSTAEATWSGTIERTRVPWLADHVIGGTVVMPAAAFLELAMAAGRRLFNAPVEVIGLEVRRPLVVPSDDDAPDIELQVSLSDEDGVLRIASRSGAGEWIVNARGRVQRLLAREPDAVDPRLPAVSLGTLAASDMYSEFAARDMTFGPRLRLLRQLSVGPGEVLATYEQEEADARFEIHPAILDAALQSGFPLFIPQGGDKPFLLVLIERTRVWQPPARSGLVHARVRSLTNESACWDVTVTDEQGRVAVEVLGCWARRAAARTRPHQHLQTVLRAAPHDLAPIGPVALPSPDHVVAAVSGELVDILSSWGPHEGVRAGLQDLQGAFVGQAVERLLPGAGVFNAVDLIAAGVMPKFARLLDLLLGLAAGSGCLQRVGNGYCLADVRSPEGIFRRLAADHPDTINALTLFGRCGAHLVEILQGQRDPTQMLYAESERSVV